MSGARFRRRAVGVVSALLLAVCGPLTASAAAQPGVSSGTPMTPAAEARAKHSVVTWGASADRQGRDPPTAATD